MSEALAIGTRFRWLGFFIQHASLIPALLELFQEWQAAEGAEAKAEVLKSLIDLLKGVVADIPLGEAVISGDVQAMVAENAQTLELKLGNGALLKRLMENLPAIISILTTLAPLLKK